MDKDDEAVILKLGLSSQKTKFFFGDYRKLDVPGVRVAFSAHQCFAFDEGAEDLGCLEVLGKYLGELNGLALYGNGPLVEYLLEHAPDLRNNLVCLVSDVDPVPDEKIGIG
ncbi:MAG: hypothetical protein LGR52_13210 [Candidatus Thiosymbion ectosymbiont of Robbea hypermnestra]|nr:hypothetical protein [Candidatus Thiosymbion ectosymbiont of Robbea hypermnestra]